MLHTFRYVLLLARLYVCVARNDISNLDSIASLTKLHDYQGLISGYQDEEYALCITKLQEQIKNQDASLFGPFYKFAVEQETVSLPCSPCRYVSKPIPTWFKVSFENEKTPVVIDSDKYKLTPDDSLIINSASQSDFGTYYCMVNDQVGYIWTLESESHTHLKIVSAKMWESNGDSKVMTFSNMIISIQWEPWASCNKCTYVGKTHRLGYCNVQKPINTFNSTEHPSFKILDIYKAGVSCNLFFITHFSEVDVDITRALMRGPFIMLNYCKVSCDDLQFDPQTKFRKLNLQIREFYKEDLKTIIEDEELTQEYNERVRGHGKFQIFSIIPKRKPTTFEWFLMLSLSLLQLYIVIHICKNRSKAK